jgi:hypothetical protein
MSILYDYQIQPSAQLVRALKHGERDWGYSGCADLSEVGTGKTAVDLNAMLEIGREVIVLCPKVGINGWLKMFSLFGARPRFIDSYESCKLGFRPEVAVRSGDSFKWKNAGDVGIILDECQAVKGMGSLASLLIDGAINDNIPIICASATLASSPVELRIAGQVTGLHKGGHDWPRFLAEYGCRYNEDEDRWIWNGKPHLLQQLHHILIPARGCRMTKAMMTNQPGTTIKLLPIQCPEGPEIQREWQSALDQLSRMAKQGYPKQVVLNTRRTIRMRLWKKSELALAPHIAKRIKQDVEEGNSAVAFFSFTESRELVGKLLNTRAGFYGGQTATQRTYFEREFQANRIRILLNNIGAGGASVNLQDTSGHYPRVSYIFPNDSAVKMGQAPGRIDRAGAKSASVQWIPCIAGGLTEAMVKSTSRKLLAMAGLNDGTAS